jgi:hypothetical protein
MLVMAWSISRSGNFVPELTSRPGLFPEREINLSPDDGRHRAYASAQAVAGFEDAGAGTVLNILYKTILQ